MLIVEETKKCDPDESEAWRRIRDLEGIPAYWRGTRKLEMGEKTADGIIRAMVDEGLVRVWRKG